jgi:hypothetical protein
MGFPNFAAALIRNKSVDQFRGFAVSFAAVRFTSKHRRIGVTREKTWPELAERPGRL